ncbi:uncharacterized protein TNCV_4728481 [Trichonephila clavipes]|nr:uncharacterized protein TNCV_4728481 [Trichonephila clavipes]
MFVQLSPVAEGLEHRAFPHPRYKARTPGWASASRTNLAKLDRVQSSAARIITGMRHSCPTDLVLFEADIMPLDLRRKLLLSKQAPGDALSIKADRVVQTAISRLASGHITGLSFHLGQKIYENCTKCNLVQATPDHLLFCAGLDREDIYSSPLLVYDFLRTLGLMDLV